MESRWYLAHRADEAADNSRHWETNESQSILSTEAQARIRGWRHQILLKIGMRVGVKMGRISLKSVREAVKSSRYPPMARSSWTNLSLPGAENKIETDRLWVWENRVKLRAWVRCCTENRKMSWNLAYWVVRPPARLCTLTPKWDSGGIPPWKH